MGLFYKQDCFEEYTSPCGSKRCGTCQHIKTSKTIKTSDPDKSYKLRTSATCKTEGTVHLIECIKCKDYKYLGKTTRALHIRLNEYRYDVKHNTEGSAVAEHFNLRGHSMRDLTIRVIEQDDDDKTLKTLIKRWIKKLVSDD